MKHAVFFGFGALGVVCLEELRRLGYATPLVFTHASDAADSVLAYCRRAEVPVELRDARKHPEELTARIRDLKPDALISVNYRFILPAAVLETAPLALNLHGSLLPQYRGRTPHVWAIIQGETESGVTCHRMVPGVDQGDIACQIRVPIAETDTGATLLKKLEAEYPRCLREGLERVASGAQLIAQEAERATYFGKRTPDMGLIDFRLNVRQTLDFIRAQAAPYPGAYCFLADGSRVRVHRAEVMHAPAAAPPHSPFPCGDFLAARCRDGYIKFADYALET